jgi:hypothetical protein
MSIIGYILLVLGCIVCLVGEIMFLTVAYKRSLLWFFGCLFVPIVWFIFFFMNLRATARPFALSIVGLLLACLGGWMVDIEL